MRSQRVGQTGTGSTGHFFPPFLLRTAISSGPQGPKWMGDLTRERWYEQDTIVVARVCRQGDAVLGLKGPWPLDDESRERQFLAPKSEES
jgi:hypothetical protein